MIKEIRYKNFKALRNATLPLGRFTLIVGANGTGKSTALQALKMVKKPHNFRWVEIISAELKNDTQKIASLNIKINETVIAVTWKSGPNEVGNLLFEKMETSEYISDKIFADTSKQTFNEWITTFNLFSFDAEKISLPVQIESEIEMDSYGENLAGVLLSLTSEPEIFENLNLELQNWFPEFDRVVFNFPEKGKVSFLLRTKVGKHKIKAEDLSDGTRLALAYLTLAYLPNPPKIVAFEEPEKGIHPRLLENIQEAMYRLAYPENYGEEREPIQVIATTHSPYLLDLYKDYPEEIVIASKDENGVHFERLIDKPHFEEVIQDAPLGEVWFTGVLGGVPVQP